MVIKYRNCDDRFNLSGEEDEDDIEMVIFLKSLIDYRSKMQMHVLKKASRSLGPKYVENTSVEVEDSRQRSSNDSNRIQ